MPQLKKLTGKMRKWVFPSTTAYIDFQDTIQYAIHNHNNIFIYHFSIQSFIYPFVSSNHNVMYHLSIQHIYADFCPNLVSSPTLVSL